MTGQAMLEAIWKLVSTKVFAWAGNKAAQQFKRAEARAALDGGDQISTLTVQGHLSRVIAKLVNEPLLNDATKVSASKDWLILPSTLIDLTDYVVGRLGKSDDLVRDALGRMRKTYAEVTLEAPQLADGVVLAVAEYACVYLARSPDFAAANVLELAAHRRMQDLGKSLAFDRAALVSAAAVLLAQAPKLAQLLPQRIPSVFECESEKQERTRLDVDALVNLLIDRRIIVMAGEGGIGKTTGLIELGHTLLTKSNGPIPLYISAAHWSRSGQSLLEYLAKHGACCDLVWRKQIYRACLPQATFHCS